MPSKLKHPAVPGTLVVLGASVIFILRNIALFRNPNFYAEDATVLFQNIYSLNPFQVLLTAFNGYLIVGQYLLAYVAAGLNLVAGNDLENLPFVTMIVSCLFLGLTASLPYLLFRKQLGKKLALLLVLLTALVPLQSYDYAIIGTISNLKFIFLYIAFMLVVYRIVNRERLTAKGYVLIDAALFICVLTNVTVAFLLPLILLPYLKDWFVSLRQRTFPKLALPQLIGVGIVAASLAYVALALLKGIPKIPGYLDGPFDKTAILPILDRSIGYGLTYPITSSFNDKFVAFGVVLLAALVLWLLWRRNQDSYVVIAACWAIFLGTVLFIVNRPGIGDYYLTYGHKGGPDQFFYAQNMVFIFAAGWLLRGPFNRPRRRSLLLGLAGLVLYLLLALPHGTSFGGSSVVYKGMEDIDSNLTKACRQYADKPKVIIQIYPTTYWQWQVDRRLACDN